MQPVQNPPPVPRRLVERRCGRIAYLRVASERVDQLAIARLPDLNSLIRGCHQKQHKARQQRTAVLLIDWTLSSCCCSCCINEQKKEHLGQWVGVDITTDTKTWLPTIKCMPLDSAPVRTPLDCCLVVTSKTKQNTHNKLRGVQNHIQLVRTYYSSTLQCCSARLYGTIKQDVHVYAGYLPPPSSLPRMRHHIFHY